MSMAKIEWPTYDQLKAEKDEYRIFIEDWYFTFSRCISTEETYNTVFYVQASRRNHSEQMEFFFDGGTYDEFKTNVEKQLDREASFKKIEKLETDINDNVKTTLKDDGNRKVFESGAFRDISEGKGRCDLLPLDTISSILQNFNTVETNILILIDHFKQTKEVEYLHTAIMRFSEHYYDSIYTAILNVSKQYEEGSKKYEANNWKKGLPLHCYIDSGVRHLLKFFRGDTDEPHDRAFIWNMLGAIWTFEHMPDLDDIES